MGNLDFSKPFEVHCDASYKGLGATLVQHVNKQEVVISYASRALVPSEKNYGVWELESLCCIWAMRLWRLFLAGKPFTVVTDSEATKTVLDQNYQKGGGRLLRWSLAASEFDYTITHRNAARHCDADGLSRFPINEDSPYNEDPTTVEPHNVLLCQYGDNISPR